MDAGLAGRYQVEFFTAEVQSRVHVHPRIIVLILFKCIFYFFNQRFCPSWHDLTSICALRKIRTFSRRYEIYSFLGMNVLTENTCTFRCAVSR